MMGTTGWGFFEQGSDQLQERMEMGEWLSLVLHCPVHYPAYGKNLFECQCGVIFPLYVVKYRNEELVTKKHKEEQRMLEAI
jgi:hypothetical protein